MSDILIGVIVFGFVFGAAVFGMFLGRNLRVLEQKVTPATLLRRGYGVPSMEGKVTRVGASERGQRTS